MLFDALDLLFRHRIKLNPGASMARKVLLVVIRVLVSLNLLGAAILFKFAGVPLSVALFTKMSNAAHGLISQPVFRIGTGIIETALAILFLIPKTAKLGAACIAVYMIAPILSHVFVLGYGAFFVNALATLFLACVYLYFTRIPSHDIGVGVVTATQTR
jgi:hypothetical protein